MKKSILYRTINHIKTVNKHRREVRKNCFKCGLYKQGLLHDISKYSLKELIPSIRYYTDGKKSPYVTEKEKFGMSYGWLHHKGRNMHHWEYWNDYIKGEWVKLEMPLPYFIEMVCDRVAACKVYEGSNYTNESAYNYFHKRPEANHMHPSTAKKLDEVFIDIAKNGEDVVFARLKKEYEEYKKKNK